MARGSDRSISEFYYIVRQASEWNVITRASVIGPFNELEYQQEKRKTATSEFSKVFGDLR